MNSTFDLNIKNYTIKELEDLFDALLTLILLNTACPTLASLLWAILLLFCTISVSR